MFYYKFIQDSLKLTPMENIVQFLVPDKAAAIRVVQILHHLSAESSIQIQDLYLVRRDRVTNKIFFSEANNLPTDDSIWTHPADPMTLSKRPFDFVNVTFSGDDTGALSDSTFSEQVAQHLPPNQCMIVAHLTESNMEVLESRMRGIADIKRLTLNVNENGTRSVAGEDMRRLNRVVRKTVAASTGHTEHKSIIDRTSRELDELSEEIDKQRNYIKNEIHKMEDESSVAPWQEYRDPLSEERKLDSPLPQAQYKVDKTITQQDAANIVHASKQKVEQVEQKAETEIAKGSLSQRISNRINNRMQQMSNSFEDAMEHLNPRQGLTFFEKVMLFFGFTPASVKIKNNK